MSLADLALAPGAYFLVISGDADPAEHYTLTRAVTGVRETGREDEPNDIFQAASPLDAQNRASGRFAGADGDVYRLVVTGKPQLWRIQIVGDGLGQVRILNAVGEAEQSADAVSQRRLRITNVFLLPGTHYIEVRGENSDYRVMAIPLGPPPEGVEQEPNDAVGQANPLSFDAVRTGLLNEATDSDTYRFTLATQEHIRLTVAPPDDGSLQVRVSWKTSSRSGAGAMAATATRRMFWTQSCSRATTWCGWRPIAPAIPPIPCCWTAAILRAADRIGTQQRRRSRNPRAFDVGPARPVPRPMTMTIGTRCETGGGYRAEDQRAARFRRHGL